MKFAMILRTQWTWTRTALLSVTALAFLLPIILIRLYTLGGISSTLNAIVEQTTLQTPLTLLAIIGPFVLAALPWAADAEAKHVYALSLPIPWREYVALRYGAGAVFLLLPALALYVSTLLLLSRVTLPDVLHAYPGALALRFLLASLVAYSATFALQYLAGRRGPAVLLGVLVGAVLLGGVAVVSGHSSWIDAVQRGLIEWPGPFAVFVEPWVLIDV
ncbi:MAG: hypothetical protein KF709_02110 [Gemmatimonadaceae bacterium]|nr:hypothetical protein [Gemmatimonadaceae bacterium]